MGIRPSSYGSVAEVEALVKKYTTEGSFDTVSHPTLAQVEVFIDKVSAIANTFLAEQGFTIPVSQVSAKLALDEFVDQIAAALCEEANSAGRFYTETLADQGTFNVIREDAEAFIIQHAQGLEDLGAERTRDLATAWMGAKPISTA